MNGKPINRTHAILDIASREKKALKILRLLENHGMPPDTSKRVLEVGTGSGAIAAFLAKQQNTIVDAVDIVDERQVTAGYKFQIVSDTNLPFSSNFFDIAISNHVIEHVGGTPEQVQHLLEIFRCLKPDGVLYLAVPNRWRLIEPHYRLPILSWFPSFISSFYLRILGKSEKYDCKPLSRRQAQRLLRHSGFRPVEVTLDAIGITGELEGNALLRRITKIPRQFWRIISPVFPTLIFICRKSGCESEH